MCRTRPAPCSGAATAKLVSAAGGTVGNVDLSSLSVDETGTCSVDGQNLGPAGGCKRELRRVFAPYEVRRVQKMVRRTTTAAAVKPVSASHNQVMALHVRESAPERNLAKLEVFAQLRA